MRVTLVGAGPGDRGLLTLRGAERIQNADVVVYDRFVSDEILAMIPDNAEKIDVGKNAGNHPVPQEEINRILLEKAGQGLDVVRLKGGDPFVFGRGGEELELLVQDGVDFEVVPGVTSAIAGAAYAGIPATHREYSSSLHLITAHGKNNEKANINYGALVSAGGTLVFMMGVSAIDEIIDGCLAAGMDRVTPAAIVENATLGNQRKFLGTVETLPEIALRNGVGSPAIIIIGKVCGLSERYDWFGGKPLAGRRVIVSRVKPGISKLSEGLRELGCHVAETPRPKITPLTTPGCLLETAFGKINDYSWLLFTSGAGVNAFFGYMAGAGIDVRTLSHLKVACVGAETEKEVNKRGIRAYYCPAEFSGEALARGLAGIVEESGRLLIARAKDGGQDLTRILAEAGISFDDVAVYEKTRGLGKIQYGGADFAAFTSSSAVEWFTEATEGVEFTKVHAVCIGERTGAAARSHGMQVYISAEATVDSMIKKIKEMCSNGK